MTSLLIYGDVAHCVLPLKARNVHYIYILVPFYFTCFPPFSDPSSREDKWTGMVVIELSCAGVFVELTVSGKKLVVRSDGKPSSASPARTQYFGPKPTGFTNR